MNEERPEPEPVASPHSRKGFATAARHVGKILKERTDPILEEQLPESMEHLLDRLREIER
jgi:hypothetical protein